MNDSGNAFPQDASAADSRQKQMRHWRHAFRTPMNAIMGYAEMLLDDAKDTQSDEAVQTLREILRICDTILVLIDKLVEESECNSIGENCEPLNRTAQEIMECQTQISALAQALSSNAQFAAEFKNDVEAIKEAAGILGELIAQFKGKFR